MVYWLLLLVTIIFEVAGTIAMKLSNGLTKLVPSVLIFVFYGICFSVFAIVVKKIHLSIAYAIWSGVGTLLITIISVYFFKEHISLFQAFCILFIVLGVIGLKVSSASWKLSFIEDSFFLLVSMCYDKIWHEEMKDFVMINIKILSHMEGRVCWKKWVKSF